MLAVHTKKANNYRSIKWFGILFQLVVITSLLIACSPVPATLAPTETKEAMPADIEMPTATAMPEIMDPTVTVPAATATVQAPSPMVMAASAFNVSASQYFLDAAGFHGMATTLAESKAIDASYLGTVNRVKKVLVQTVWPAKLNDQAQAFISRLGEFGAALEADNVDDAIKLSEEVHDAQHELSHAVDHWFEADAMAGKGASSAFDVSVAQYFLDAAGFHGMATTLAESKAIDASYLGTVNRVKKVLVQTMWPTELNDQAQAFISTLGEFGAALEADNVDDAIKLSEEVHDAQHELSHAVDHWFEADAIADKGDASAFDVSVAQYFLDAAGFHGMATTLAESKAIDASYLGTVNRVKKVLVQTVWPTELNEQAQAFVTSLGEFGAALEADNVDDAIKLSDAIHDAQHELSHAVDHWFEAHAAAH